jgi:glutamate-5-semialdehyde dehydrogenase
MATTSGRPAIITALQSITHTANGLAQTDTSQRSLALTAMAKALLNHQDAILEANTLDLELSREMAIPDRVVDWLKLTPERINRTGQILHRLSALGDLPGSSPLGSWAVSRLRPLGVVALVYEGFPDLGAMAAGLCMRTGNTLVLRGGSESSQTNQVLVSVLQAAISTVGLPTECLSLLPSEWGEISRTLLVQQPAVDLVIPYGRPELVAEVVEQASVPVLPTCIGNCYLCVGASAKPEIISQMIIDSHCGDPDAVNRIEKVVLVGSPSENLLLQVWRQLREAGFELRGEIALCETFRELTPTTATEWKTPYLDKIVAFRQAVGLIPAIDWINEHSNGHADCIATQNYDDSRQFIAAIRSASVFVNTSPRFSRNPEEATAIALGMSNRAGQWGGLVGMDALRQAQRVIHSHPSHKRRLESIDTSAT